VTEPPNNCRVEGNWAIEELLALRGALKEAQAQVAALQAENERLRDEAANWHNLRTVYKDAEDDNQALRAAAEEALVLLEPHAGIVTGTDWTPNLAARAQEVLRRALERNQ
jgi:hypothetical protein